MSLNAALFKILYQDDTLYQLPESRNQSMSKAEPSIIEKTVAPKTIIPIEAEQVPIPETAKQAFIPEPVVSKVPAPPIAQIDPFPLLNHKILILIDEPKQKEMIASESVFLDNILKAVKSSLATADVINFSFLPNSDARIVLAEKRTNYFITFGVPLIKLNLDLLLIPYTPKLVEGIWFLLTDPLVVIESDRDLKRKLWQALQKMFEKA